mmetsp:Transcript_25228/g.63345  ORF Transcript_25228/g.63345 Transcript_25228/m.63345 type:complete len:335 (+) Transcript_25228:269-1273(+)
MWDACPEQDSHPCNMFSNPVDHAFLPELLVQRTDISSGSEHLKDHCVPSRHLLPIPLPPEQKIGPSSLRSCASHPKVREHTPTKSCRTEEFESSQAEAGDVEARLVLLAEALVRHDLVCAVETHKEGARGPIAAVARDVRIRPELRPGARIDRQAKVDEPERGTARGLLWSHASAHAAAIDGIRDQDVVRVHITMPRMWRDPLQGGAELPDQLGGQDHTATKCNACVLVLAWHPLQEGVQGLPGHPRHGHSHPPSTIRLPLHRVRQVARDSHHRSYLSGRWRGQLLEPLQERGLEGRLLELRHVMTQDVLQSSFDGLLPNAAVFDGLTRPHLAE